MRGDGQFVSCVAVSRDGELVLSGSRGRTVQRWDVSEQRNVTEQQLILTSPDKIRSDPIRMRIVYMNACANGKLAVSGSENSTVHRWHMLTGEAVVRPRDTQAQVGRAVFCSKK